MTTISKLSHEQLVKKASSELAVVDKEEAAAQATISTIDAEIVLINAQMGARANELATLFQTASHLQAQYDTLVTEDRLSVGTLAEGNLAGPLRAALKEKEKAERALATFEAKVRKDDTNDSIKLQSLETERVNCTQRLGAAVMERATLEQAKANAFAAIGLGEFRDITFQLDLLNRQIDAHQSAVRQAEAEREDFAREAVQRLASWPEHLEAIKPTLPFDDSATRILETAIALFALVLEQGDMVKIDSDLLRRVSPWTGHVLELLVLQISDIWPITTGRVYDAKTLRERQAQFELLLKAHREQQKRGV